MSERRDGVDDRLEQLARATDALAPRADFVDRVMVAVQAEPDPGWLAVAGASARWAISAAVLAAAVALVLSVQVERDVQQVAAAAVGTEEVDW